MLLLGPDKYDKSKPRTPIRQDKMFEAFTDYLEFNEIVGITNVAELNNAVLNDNASMLINVAETLHNAKFSQIADKIAARYRKGYARIVLIAGPSSSGKTTSSKRLAIQLMINRIVPKVISLDNYFVNREDTPKDENGDYDYESLHALDLELFNSDMQRLINGEEVDMPTYDFASGKRVFKGEKMKLDKNNILLIEGIHGLNPELTSLIPEEQKFRVYVSALTTLTIERPQLGTHNRQPFAASNHTRPQISRSRCFGNHCPVAKREKRRRKVDFPVPRKRRRDIQLFIAV